MNKITFGKRSRYRFLLLLALLIVLISSLLVATFRSSNTENLNAIIAELSISRKDAEQVEKAIGLMYSAENNFRTFVLTGNKANFRQYAVEIKKIEEIFYVIEDDLKDRDDLPGLFKDKKEKTDIFIKARLLADSLIQNSVSWDTTSLFSGFLTEQYRPQTVIVQRVDRVDSTLSASPGPAPKRKLLGRLRDAFANKAEEKGKTEVKVVKSTSSVADKVGSEVVVTKVPQRKVADLRAMTLSLRRKEFDLLQSNNKLFSEIKELLDRLRSVEIRIAQEKSTLLSNNAGLSLKNLNKYNTWQFFAILLLIACVGATLFWIYRNDLKLIMDARKAAIYAKLKTEFVFTTSHEIRSPIYVMQLYAEQLASEDLTEIQKNMVEGLTNSSKMTLAIVNRILDTIEVEYNQLRKAIFYPQRTISEVITSLSIFSNQNGIILRSDSLPPPDFALLGDEFRLRQVLINLISNAFKFTEKGYIAVKCSTADGKDPDHATLVISIEDTGVGIPEKYLETVFEQFTYLNVSDESAAQMKSNGLGLYIVKKIIDEHGGRITIRSQVGEGTIFTFELPYQRVTTREPIPAFV